jgi:4-amino-4-deoxy-L-arabinose transferase-like glycosyltransferase
MDRRPPLPPLAWPPYLWRRVLFPGGGPAAEAGRPGLALAALLILPALLLYPRLSFRLLEPDEGRYAQVPVEMLRRGDLLVPTLQGEPYLDKPPLFYWLVAASYALFGVGEASARLVPALATHGTILLTYLLGRRWLGERSAFRGALLLTLAPGFTAVARLLVMDGLLTFWATLALLAAFEAVRGERLRPGWWLTAALACGLGVLTKGPVAVVLLLPPLWLHRRLSGVGVKPSRRAWLIFGLVVLIVAMPWYVALCLRVPGFVRHFFWEHHVVRFLTPFTHEQGVFYYGPLLLAGLLPGSLLLWPFVKFLLSGDAATAGQRGPGLGFAVLAGGWVVLFFSLSACKLPTYVLPALPFLCLALGHFLAVGPWRGSRALPVGAAVSFVLLAAVQNVAVPAYAAWRSPMVRPDVLERLCGDGEVVVCYPRPVDSVAFYLGRSDLKNYRSKEIEELRDLVRSRPRTVILCTHRSSLKGLRQLLPPEVRVTQAAHLGLTDVPGLPPRWGRSLARLLGETALGLSDVAVVERR